MIFVISNSRLPRCLLVLTLVGLLASASELLDSAALTEIALSADTPNVVNPGYLERILRVLSPGVRSAGHGEMIILPIAFL
jgi:hypothetical protein